MSADAEESRVGAKFYRIAWIFYLALAIAGLLWIGTQRGRLGIELFVDPGSWWIDLGAGVAIGAALLALWWALRRFFAAARSLEDELAALLAPLSVAEELFFRGALQGAIGFLPAAVLFALMHAGPGKGFRIWTLFALAGGLALGALVALRGPLGGAIVAHLMVNGVNLVRLARRAPQSAEPSELSEPAPASAASDPDDPAAHE